MPGTRPGLSRPSAAATSLVLAASFVLSGCSSSSTAGAGAASSSGAASTSAAASSTSAAATTSSSAAATGSTTSSGGGGGLAAGTGFCRQAALAQAAQAKAAKSFDVSSPAALQKIEQQGLTQLNALAATAPSAIRSDLQVLVAADQRFYAALQAANFDMRKVSPAALSSLNSPDFAKATQSITTYLAKQCGIQVSPSP